MSLGRKNEFYLEIKYTAVSQNIIKIKKIRVFVVQTNYSQV